MSSNRTDHIRLTSHPEPGAKHAFPIAWGAPTARERGPIIGTVSRPQARNVIGTHGGSYAIYRALAVSSGAPFAAAGDEARRWYGIQFHPEVIHTRFGRDLLRNFLLDICGAAAEWRASSFVADAVARVGEQVGQGRVICALSGGVDSAVAALIIHQAVGDRLTCVFVDNGLLREGERDEVESVFRQSLGIPLRVADASMDIAGPGSQLRLRTEGAPMNGRAESTYRYTVIDTIGGGSSEVQKNIIARRKLGLPKNF